MTTAGIGGRLSGAGRSYEKITENTQEIMMTTTAVEHHQNTHGGFTVVASYLETLYPERRFSRQAVYMWWSRRDHNGFPEGWPTRQPPSKRRQRAFNLDEVAAWYEAYTPTRRGPHH